MALEGSILNSIKFSLGLTPGYTPFDQSILMYVNLAFSDLQQLGIGDPAGFQIEDETPKWEDFLTDFPQLGALKMYVALKVKLLFDPPGTSFAIEAINREIEQQTWRLNVARETTDWIPPEEDANVA